MTDSLLHQTIANLESTLPELEEQERRLRRELKDVVQRVTSARHALEHLRVLTGITAPDAQPSPLAAVTTPTSPAEATPLETTGDSVVHGSPEPATAATPAAAAEPESAAPAVPQPRAAATSRTKASPAKKRTDRKKAAAKKSASPAKPKAKKVASKRASTAQPAAKDTGGLIEAALAVLKKSSVPMRAREINAALGREATPGQIESVRNTLDRVAKQQKLVARPGRGTYAAI